MRTEGWPAIEPQRVLAQITAALKAGGQLLPLDHAVHASALEAPPAPEAYVLYEVGRAGLNLYRTSDRFRRRADAQSTSSPDPAIRDQTDRYVLLLEMPVDATQAGFQILLVTRKGV